MANTFTKRVLGPRAEYQETQRQRVQESPRLAEVFPKLKSLTVTLEYYDSKLSTILSVPFKSSSRKTPRPIQRNLGFFTWHLLSG